MFNVGDWVIESNGALGYIEFERSHNRYAVTFPEFEKTLTRFVTELKPAPIETNYNEYNVLFLQRLAFDTVDEDWFNELSNRLGVK